APARLAARIHEVQRGDNLTWIARRHGVTVPALVAANRLPNDRVVIRIGQRLVIPPPLGVEGPPPSPPRSLRHRPPLSLVLAVPDFGDRLPLFAWPADGHVTSAFGRRRSGWHHGVDIKGDRRGPVLASAGGVVVASAFEHLYGRVVKIEHHHGFLTVYAHNARNLVTVGDRVLPGQTIALIGRTGRATAHHLHFEIRQRGLAYNPLYLLPLPPRIAVVDGGHGHDEGPR
ncbi:MAG: M23 family metallopeptidase, partial [Candidatus Rokuibacteriota bacterium]